ncbi:hypothetical protein PSTG_18727, partial [Puccinia striiformis f. sp. tritici PST-78]
HENGAQPYTADEISKGINDSVNDVRWSGLRYQNNLFNQRQSGVFEQGDSTVPLTAQSPKASETQVSLFTPKTDGEAAMGQITEAMSKAMDENKFQLEITLVNPQTGERRKVQTEGGGRVALSMQSIS